jgi:hypothetical protein
VANWLRADRSALFAKIFRPGDGRVLVFVLEPQLLAAKWFSCDPALPRFGTIAPLFTKVNVALIGN